MIRNIGRLEQGIRLMLGLVLIGTAYVASTPQWAAVALYVAGAILVGTAAMGFCPVWKLVGMNTSGTHGRAHR